MASDTAAVTDARGVSGAGSPQAASAEERYFIASQRQLMWRKFRSTAWR